MAERRRRPSSPKSSSTESTVERVEHNTLLVPWDDLPAWLQDNQFIRSSYRPASGSYAKSFSSLGYLHNESVNIYTHLVGAIFHIIFSGVVYGLLRSRYSSASTGDLIAFGGFFAGVSLCLGMSATYHMISNHSHEVAKFGNKLDYVGIVLLISGSFVGSVYYGFFCKPEVQKFYWSMICSLGAGCAVVSILPRFRTPEWRTFRASTFVALGLSGAFPVIHGWLLYGLGHINSRMGLSWVILEGFLYILGAAIYAARVPESIRPGSHDVWGSSHQIFHVLVLLAAGSHLVGLVKAFDYTHSPHGLKC